MASNERRLQQFQPEKLVRNFDTSSFMTNFVAALAVHLVFVGALSWGYLYDRYVDPEGAKAREAQRKALLEAAENVGAATKPAATRPARAAKPAETQPLSPVERRVYEQPDPRELPKDPFGGPGLPMDPAGAGNR